MNCKKIVRSGHSWDIRGHRCGRKAFKDGLCKLHQPEAVEAREQKKVSAYQARLNARLRSATHEAHAPILAAALRMLLDLPLTADKKAAQRALDSYERDLKRYED